MAKKPLQTLYDSLRANNYDVPDNYGSFERTLTAPGKEGVRNRQTLYKALRDNNYDVPDTYESFSRTLFSPVKPTGGTAASGQSQLPADVAERRVRTRKPQETHPLNKSRARQRLQAQQQAIENQQQRWEQDNKRFKEDIARREQRLPGGMDRFEERAKEQLATGEAAPMPLAPNDDVVRGDIAFNPTTGRMEQTYTTPEGGTFFDRNMAQFDHSLQNMPDDEIEMLEREQELIGMGLLRRGRELEQEYQGQSWWDRLLAGFATDPEMGPGPRERMAEDDEELQSLLTAWRKNRDALSVLYDKRNNDMNSFWHTFGNTVANGYTFTGGKAELHDAQAIINSSKHMDEIQRKMKAGEKLSNAENAALSLAQNTAWDNAIQAMYGDDYGAWATAGGAAVQSLEMMPEFIAGMPILKGMGTAAIKLLTRNAVKGFGRYMLKGLGMTLGTMAGGAIMANTIQAERTLGKAAGNAAGSWWFGDDGEFMLGHYDGDNFVSGGESLGAALFHAEREAIPEAASEGAGEFLPGIGQVLSKIGLSRIAKPLASLSGKGWYKTYQSMLRAAGWHGVGGEALEEYVGTLDGLLMGDLEGVKRLADPRTHFDIWLSCATLGPLLNAPVVLGSSMRGVYSPVAYHKIKAAVTRQDKIASFRLTEDRWAPWRERIDGTPNEQMADLMMEVRDDQDLAPQEKKAIFDYVKALQGYRGWNLGEYIFGKDAEEDGEGKTEQEQQQSQEYSNGYETVTPEERRAAKDRLDVARARLEYKGYTEQWMQWVESTPIDDVMSDLTERGLAGDTEAVTEYLNAKAAYDGMLARVNDNIDDEVAIAGETIAQRVAPENAGGDGMIHPAVLKGGREVFIISGNVATLADNSIDAENSDSMIIVRDAEGNEDTISPDKIQSLGEVIDPAQQRQQAEQMIVDEQGQAAAAQIEGQLPFNVGARFTIYYQGAPHTYDVVDADENNVAVLVDGGSDPVVLTKQQLQQMADEEHAQQIQAQAAAADAVEEEPAAVEPEQTVEAPAVEETPAAPVAPEDNPTSSMPMDDQGEPAWNQVAPEIGHQYLYQQSGWPQAMADNFVQARIDEAEKALKKAQDEAQKLIDKPKKTVAENNAAMAQNTAALNAAQAALDYWKGVQAIQAQATAPVVETPAEQEPTEQAAPVAEAEAPAEPVEETPAVETEQPAEAPVAENEMQPVEVEQPAEAAPAAPAEEAPQSDAIPEQHAEEETPEQTELDLLKEEFHDELSRKDIHVEILPETVEESSAEIAVNVTVDGQATNIWFIHGVDSIEEWREIAEPFPEMGWQELDSLAEEYNQAMGKAVCDANDEAKRLNFYDIEEAIAFEKWMQEREQQLKEQQAEAESSVAADIQYSIEQQGEIPMGNKQKKFDMAEANSSGNGNEKAYAQGVYHDPKGYAVSSDGHILVASKRAYDEKHKGKLIASKKVKKGTEIKEPIEKGAEVPIERYPNWRSVKMTKDNSEAISVDLKKFADWMAGAETRMKEQWQQWKDSHPTYKRSFAEWRHDSKVQVLMPDGKVRLFDYDKLQAFARAAADLDAKTLRYRHNSADQGIQAESKHGFALLMPLNLYYYQDLKGGAFRALNGMGVDQNSSFFTYDMSNGLTMPGKTSTGRVELNYESGKDAESRAYIEEVMEREGWDEEAKSEFRKILDDAADLVSRMAQGFTRLREWNNKKLTDEQGNYNPLWRVYDEDDGWIPTRSSFKKNGEYPYNIDLGALCTKREAFDAVVRYIKEQGWGQNLGPTQIEALKSLLREHGFLTACDICFNETRRARALDYGNAVAYYWNAVRQAVGIDDDLPIGTPRELTEEQMKRLTELSKSGKAFSKYVPKELRRTYETYVNTKGQTKRREVDKGLTPTMTRKVAKLFLQDPSLMGKFEGTMVLSTDSVDALVRQFPHTDIARFLAGAWGSNTPKPNEGFNIYDPLSWKQTYDKKRQRPAMDWFFNLGGMRAQSFSDYSPIFFYDYVQMFTDLAIRRLPIHIYTKVPALIKLFGGTGAKFNMSLVPEVVQGVDAEHLGLKPDGNGGWVYAWHEDSFPVDEAFALRQDPRFKGNVGTIAVGISDAHIRMLLDDPTIDMVIPYHKSGMPPSIQVKTGLDKATDYTDDQHSKKRGKALKNDFSFNEALRRLGDPRKAADEYLAWCKENNYTPKYPQFADHPNYYKVLEDFRCIDNEDNYSPQQPVQVSFFDDVEQRLSESLADRTMQEGLDNAIRGNEAITEGIKKIMSKPRLDGKIRDMMLARLKQVLGKDNVASLKQEDFFEELQKVYTDQMGAERAQQQVEVLRTSGGIVYGFAVGNRIVLNENYFNAETPMHEFTHVWVKVARLANPQMWAEGKELLKQTKEWQEVMSDEFYRDIQGDEDAVASEVLARIVGQDAARQINEMFAPEDKPQERPGIYNKIKQWVNKFLDGVRSLFSENAKGLTYDELVRMPMKALFDDAEAARFMEALQQVNEEDVDLSSQGSVPTFYSNAAKAVENVKQNKATAEQWKAMLTKQGGIKAGEDKWMGLSTWLDEHKGETLTKDEVRKFVADNGIQMEEVGYSELNLSSLQEEFDEIYDRIVDGSDSNDAVTFPKDQAWEELRARYNGGDDFDMAFSLDDRMRIQVDDEGRASYFLGMNPINSTRLDYTTKGLNNKREIAFVVPGVEPYQEHDEIHFGPENQGRAVMWVRFGETTDTDGNRVLVIDEVQSNRHQDAREKGYADPKAVKAFNDWMDAKAKEFGVQPYQVESRLSDEEYHKMMELANAAKYDEGAVPAAPFEKNWHEVAMKRMLRLAAEEGFDKVAWTTGSQQADRYNLSAVLEWVSSKDNDVNPKLKHLIFQFAHNGTREHVNVNKFTGVVSSGGGPHSEPWEGRVLSDVIGKDLADRLLSEGETKISGDGLKIGGKGMHAFYDGMLPQFMNKYGKRWGVKVGEVTLDTPGKETMHSVDVTPEMRRSVMTEGQPLFQIIGEKGAAALDEVDNQQRMQNRDIAEEMERAGKDAKTIKLATGWERGADKNWRYEASDLTLNEDQFLKFVQHEGTAIYLGKLGDLVGDHELFNAYPQLRDVEITSNTDGDNYYDAEHNEITIYTGIIWSEQMQRDYAKLQDLQKELEYHKRRAEETKESHPDTSATYSEWAKDDQSLIDEVQEKIDWMHRVLNDALVHEVQHAIQEIEGFEQGGSTREFGGKPTVAVVADVIGSMYAAERVIEDGDTVESLRKKYEERKDKEDYDSKREVSVLVEAIDMLHYGSTPAEIRDVFKRDYERVWNEYNDESPESPYGKYHRLAGETEARNASKRMNMSAEERRGTLFEETEDVPRSEQILRGETSGDVRANSAQYNDGTQGDQTRSANFKNWFGDWENDPENASKVVDEEGKPLVVYHQTNAKRWINRETGEDWEKLDWRKKMEWENKSQEEWENAWEEQDFYTFDDRYARQSIEMPAIFFSPENDPHHEYGNRTIAVYLNLRNPAINPDIPNRGVTDTAGRDAMEALKAQGYDGFIRTDEDGNIREYGVFDSNQVKSADEVTFDDEGNEIPEEERYNPDEQDIRYRELDEDEDAELIDRLENGPHITTYSTKIKSGDGYVPPMSSKNNETGEMRAPEHEQKWNESEERPDLAKQDKKTGKWKFDLKKSNDKDVNGVLYNPYNHSGSGMLNDQFSEAQDRDDLVVVEQVVPQSEETDKYKAEKANDPTGWKAWKAGPITAKMTGKRKVFLSRWHKITRVVPWSEVADAVAKDLGDQFDVLPTNPFPPQLRNELEDRGYKFVKTDNKCVIQEGEYKGATWSERYYDVYSDRAKSKDKREKGARAKAVKEQNTKELFDYAKKRFGVTTDFREAGYILPDGTMLDFSGRHELNEGDDSSFLKGRRTVDHRYVSNELSYQEDGWTPTGIKTSMTDFIERGAIRINGPSSINLAVKPTKEQAATLRRYLAGKQFALIDFGNGDTTEHYAAYGDDIDPNAPAIRSSRVLADIDRYFDDGIKPEGTARYRDILEDGGTLRVYQREGKWRVEGVPGEFDTQFGAVDNARNFLQGHVFEVAEDGNSIEVLGAGSNLDNMMGADTAAEQRPTQQATAKQRKAEERARKWRERTVANGRRRVEELGQRLGVKVTIVDDMSEQEREGMSKKKRRAKGWYDVRTGEVFINLGNHKTVSDIEATFLHEVVAHKGLRRLFGDEFNTFLHNVYYNVDASIREEINRLMAKNNWDYREATEEYLAKLAQQMNFERPEKYVKAWETVARLFRTLLQKMGLGNGMNLKDSDLQGILFESYHNMEKEGVAGLAESVEFRDWMEREANLPRQSRDTENPAATAAESMFRDDEDDLEDFEDSEDFYEEELEEEAENAEDLGEEVDDSEAGESTFQEMMLGKMLQAANSAGAAQSARVSAMRSLGGALQQIRKAMSAQRNYDRETVNTIVRLAREVMASGYFNDLTRGEVKRLLAAAKNANGSANVTEQANKVVDTLLRHHLRECENLLKKQLKVKGSKENASGVEVQAGLDIEGQRMTTAMKQGMRMDQAGLSQRIAECLSRMGSSDPVVSSVAAQEYTGLMLAQQYHDNIKASRQQEQNMRQEIRDAKADFAARRDSLSPEELKRERQDLKDYIAATEDAIRQNRMERADDYNQLTEMLGSGIASSMERAKQWREQQKERVRDIQHNANSDLEGVPADEHMKPTWKHRMANWSVVRFFMKPLATFDYMLRMMGQKSPNGEGYLWNRFMGGWVEANDNEWRNVKAAHQVLDEKVKEVFNADRPGLPKFKVKRWSDLFFIERKMQGMDVDFWDDDKIKTHTLTPGNLLYIYMVNKMSDGKMKLRKMGISEEDVEAIKNHLDPRLIELADWLQDEFLVQKRVEYNAVHERMFGAPMAAIENYFPLKINDRSRSQEEDVNNQEANPDDNRGSTITGAIIKRVRNNKAIDVTGADAFDVILEHIQTMEHWAAFAEFNRDLNTLLSYKRFRNRMLNMASARFGSGKKLWTNFKRVCAIASGVYRPKVDYDSVDTNLVNVAKGVTRAKISFRFYTALKQLLSYPAYLSTANPIELAKSSNPVGAVKAWNWAIDNLPGFAERWQSRQAGDTRLKESDADWGLWKSKIIDTASRWGMSPNAFIDALTVAMGAKAIYETKFKQYKKLGYPEEQAKRRAQRDASVAYNETQQSSANAYTSAMQLDRTAASVALTVFRNASMGYQRRLFQSFANLKHMATKGYKAQSLEYLAKQMERDGLDRDAADAAAKKVYNRALYQNIADVAIFGWVMQAAWNLGAYLPYLFMGDDDDDKKDMLTDAALHAIAGGIEGLTGGSVMSDTYNSIRSGDAKATYSNELLPLLSDIESLKRTFKKDVIEGANDLVNLLVQAGVGVNPQTITDWVVAGLDMANGDPELANEWGLLVMRVMSAPQGQLDQLYIDELGLTAGEAKQLNAEEFANRYARYKMGRESTFTGWAYSDEGRNDAFDRYVKNFDRKLKERIDAQDIESLADAYDRGDGHMKGLIEKAIKKKIAELDDTALQSMTSNNGNGKITKIVRSEINKRAKAKAAGMTPEEFSEFNKRVKASVANASDEELRDMYNQADTLARKIIRTALDESIDPEVGDPYKSPNKEYGRIYNRIKTADDMEEDILLAKAQKVAKAAGDDDLAKEIASARSELTEYRKELTGGAGDAQVMKELREARKELINEYVKSK